MSSSGERQGKLRRRTTAASRSRLVALQKRAAFPGSPYWSPYAPGGCYPGSPLGITRGGGGPAERLQAMYWPSAAAAAAAAAMSSPAMLSGGDGSTWLCRLGEFEFGSGARASRVPVQQPSPPGGEYRSNRGLISYRAETHPSDCNGETTRFHNGQSVRANRLSARHVRAAFTHTSCGSTLGPQPGRDRPRSHLSTGVCISC